MKYNSLLGDIGNILLQLSALIYAIAAYRRTGHNGKRIRKIEGHATCRICGRALSDHAYGCPLDRN